MNYHMTFKRVEGNKADKSFSGQFRIDERKNSGWMLMKKGQLITGIVENVDKQVTLNFDGLRALVPKNVIGDVKSGDEKTFEVVKASEKQIELRIWEESSVYNKKIFKAVMLKDSDWEGLFSQKKQSSVKAERESRDQDTKNKLDKVSKKLTALDYRLLESEGFAVEDFTVDGLSEAADRIKAKAGEHRDGAYYKDRNHLREEAGLNERSRYKAGNSLSQYDKDSLKDILKDENIPATEENVTSLMKALDLGGMVTRLDDKAMKYLISRGMEATAENIYKACYSAGAVGYMKASVLSDEEWNALKTQVEEVINATGYEVNEENLKDAKWLIENRLPLTEETFSYKKILENLRNGMSTEELLDKMLMGMRGGINPEEANLGSLTEEDYAKLIKDIQGISDTTLSQAVKGDIKLTLRNLIRFQEAHTMRAPGQDGRGRVTEGQRNSAELHAERTAAESEITAKADNAKINREAGYKEAEYIQEEATPVDQANTDKMDATESDAHYKEIRAKRQLEEIRLKMTIDAATRLERKGFRVDTQPLERVVEELRALEESYYQGLLREAEAELSDSALQNLKDTTRGIESLKMIPCYVLGSTLSLRHVQTVTGLLIEGTKLQAELEKAGAAYETLMTVPNREYGDSIKKAFDNMDSLLSEQGIELTEQNRRAVRILGYNRMEITKEAIEQVKAYDLQVNTLIKNLHPAVAVRMIKEGINPLNVPVKELNYEIDRLKEEQGISSEDKFSIYLRKLEKENAISPEERKAYIGIYRLLYQVEKSDGAALGAVIKAGREVTLEHLLTAYQTGRKGGLDAVINDDFGMLDSLSHDKETIAEQLASFTSGSGQSDGQAGDDSALAERTEYMNRLLKQLKEELSPQKLLEFTANLTSAAEMSKSSMSQAPLLSSDRSLWERVKNIPIEKLMEQLENVEEQPGAVAEDMAAEQVLRLRELCKNAEQSIRFLNDYHVPTSPVNIMLANHVLSFGETPIKKLLRLKIDNKVESSENGLKELNELSDKLNDKLSMEEEYKQMEADAKAVLSKEYSEGSPDSHSLSELRSMGQQITFLRKLAEKEFYQIPIETEKGITNINLTLLRGTQSGGKVMVTLRSKQLGSVKAEFMLKEDELKGFIGSDSRYGLDKLKDNISEVENAAKADHITLKQMDYIFQARENDVYSITVPENEGNSTQASKESERILYRLAKAIVRMVRIAESSEADSKLAVS